MTKLEELETWEEYRKFLRDHLKLLGTEPTPFYLSAARHDFTIKGARWKGYYLLLGRFARALSKDVRKDGTRLVEGTVTAVGKELTVQGLTPRQILNANLTFKKLKLGYEIVLPTKAPGAGANDAKLEAAFKKRKGPVAQRVKAALAQDGVDTSAVRDKLKRMSEAEKAGDWAGGLRTMTELEPLLTGAELEKQETERLKALSDDELAKEDLTKKDPRALLADDDYLDSLTKEEIPYANRDDLKKVMRLVARGVSGAERQKTMQALARITGASAAELDADYDKFLVLQRQQRQVGSKNKQEAVPDVNETAHGEFMGSKPQLLFGKVLGDVFDIHPVFAALLSSTGGMVGPGNMAVHLDDDDPTGYHGIVHDAAGYLYNYHDQGPGYDYRGEEKQRDKGNPLTGQQSGMKYWHKKLDPGPGTDAMSDALDAVGETYDRINEGVAAVDESVEDAKKKAREVQVRMEKALEEARKKAAKAYEEGLAEAKKKAAELESDFEEAVEDTREAVNDALESAEETAVEAYEAAEQQYEETKQDVKDKLNAAWSYVFE